MASAGFLGAVAGFGTAVSQISQEERKNLAEKLRMEAKAELDRVYQDRGFGQQKDIVGMQHENALEREGKRFENEGILESTRQTNRMSVAEREAALREESNRQDFLRKKEAGAYDKKPISVGPGEKIVDATGKEIARSDIQPSSMTRDTRTSDEKNYERFKSENPGYQGDFMSWKKSWSSSDKTKMAYDMAQNDMRVLKDPAKIHEIAQEYLSKLSVNQTPGLMTGRMQQVGDNTFDITELVKKGRALRGVK